ncbi:hypothetical protein PO002_35505 [Cupriavidus necator]|uniref:hypothetical protein n=1 Tax=Cupriavidus necator TaxID=106590 RepID=UPI0039C06B73
MLKDENTLTYLANQIKGLGQTEGATVEITQATLRNGESVFVGGINSSASWSKAQLDELKRLGIRVAPQTVSDMTREDGGAPHAEENIASYLRDNRARGVRWSRAVVGKEGSYVCGACKYVIKSSGGYIEPGFRGKTY